MGSLFSSLGGASKKEIIDELYAEYDTHLKLQRRYEDLKKQQDTLVAENEGLNNKLNDEIYRQGNENVTCEQNIQSIMANNSEDITSSTRLLGEINADNKMLESAISDLTNSKEKLTNSKNQKITDLANMKSKVRANIQEWMEVIKGFVASVKRSEYRDYGKVKNENFTVDNAEKLHNSVSDIRQMRLYNYCYKEVDAIDEELQQVKKYSETLLE